MNTCPKCGHQWLDKAKSQGGKLRWKGVSKAERSRIAREAAQRPRKRRKKP